MIEANDLVKTFTKTEKRNRKVEINAVDGISLHVQEGEIAGILGPNGAGKTTLLRMLSKLMKPTVGRVSIRIGEKEIINEVEMPYRVFVKQYETIRQVILQRAVKDAWYAVWAGR